MKKYEHHGHKKKDYVSSEYLTWLNMKARCSNPNHNRYHRYGKRGIKVCERWNLSFNDFFADMGVKPFGMTLERKNNDGDYEPRNCRWATKAEQANNRITSEFVEYKGERHTIAEWAKIVGIKNGTLWSRIKIAGWPIERALETGRK